VKEIFMISLPLAVTFPVGLSVAEASLAPLVGFLLGDEPVTGAVLDFFKVKSFLLDDKEALPL
jgi:hypothetical protein